MFKVVIDQNAGEFRNFPEAFKFFAESEKKEDKTRCFIENRFYLELIDLITRKKKYRAVVCMMGYDRAVALNQEINSLIGEDKREKEIFFLIKKTFLSSEINRLKNIPGMMEEVIRLEKILSDLSNL